MRAASEVACHVGRLRQPVRLGARWLLSNQYNARGQFPYDPEQCHNYCPELGRVELILPGGIMKTPYVRLTRGPASFGMNDAAREVADGLHAFQVRHFFGGALFTNRFGGADGLAE